MGRPNDTGEFLASEYAPYDGPGGEPLTTWCAGPETVCTFEVGYSGRSINPDTIEPLLRAADEADPDLLISGHAIRTEDHAVAQRYCDGLQAAGTNARVEVVPVPMSARLESFEIIDIHRKPIRIDIVRESSEAPEDKPEAGKVYRLTGARGEACIYQGNSWEESVVPEPARSWIVEVTTAGDHGKYSSTGQRFTTEAGANRYAQDLAMRWTAVADWRVVPSDDDPTDGRGERWAEAGANRPDDDAPPVSISVREPMKTYRGNGVRLIVDTVREPDPTIKAVERRAVSSPREVVSVLRELQRASTIPAEREAFVVVLLNARHNVIGAQVISIGTLDTAQVHPREVFRSAIACGASAIVLAHNHPSGDCRPSAEDRRVTERLTEVGDLVGIRVLDHVILGEGAHYSIRDDIRTTDGGDR